MSLFLAHIHELEAWNEFYRVTNEILLAKEYEYFTKIFPEFA